MSMKNSTDTIGDRTRGIPSCRAVTQPIAPPRAARCTHSFLNTGRYMISQFCCCSKS